MSLWIGAIVLAFRSADAPLVSGAPPILAANFWNFVPLVLVSVALLVFIYRTLSSLPEKEPHRFHARPTEEKKLESVTQRAPLQPKDNAGRIYVSNNATPYTLMAMCEGKTSHQASRELAHYIGKWMRVSGEFVDLSVHPGHFACVRLRKPPILEMRGVSVPDVRTILYYFKSDIERLEMLEVGETVVIDGQIKEIDVYTFKLENCELVSVEND